MMLWPINPTSAQVRGITLSLLGVVLAGTQSLGQIPPPPLDSGTKPDSVEVAHQKTTEGLKGLTDPTILKRRVWLETEWEKFSDGSHGMEETLGGLWSSPISPRREWVARLKVPYEWREAPDGSRGSSEHGLGDLKLATGTGLHLGESWRTAAGLELRMPTAADDLGDRNWRLQENVAVAWDVTRWLTLSPSVEYNHSLAEVDDALPQNYLEVFIPTTFLLPHDWSVTPRYEAKVDFEKNNLLVQSVKLQVAKQLNHPSLGLALAIKKPFYSGPFENGRKEFQGYFTVTYYFR